jgi:hypothetical protein
MSPSYLPVMIDGSEIPPDAPRSQGMSDQQAADVAAKAEEFRQAVLHCHYDLAGRDVTVYAANAPDGPVVFNFGDGSSELTEEQRRAGERDAHLPVRRRLSARRAHRERPLVHRGRRQLAGATRPTGGAMTEPQYHKQPTTFDPTKDDIPEEAPLAQGHSRELADEVREADIEHTEAVRAENEQASEREAEGLSPRSGRASRATTPARTPRPTRPRPPTRRRLSLRTCRRAPWRRSRRGPAMTRNGRSARWTPSGPARTVRRWSRISRGS